MFTGIITDVGRVRSVDEQGDRRLKIQTTFDLERIELGASIACSGVCLTVIDKGPDWFSVSASTETASRTTLADWREGTAVNLERALRLGDELGGHLVSGHVDGVGTVVSRRPEGDSVRFVVQAPTALAPMIAVKGSIAVDGVSLTVNEVENDRFGVNIIPYTLAHTTLGERAPGHRVNLEIDLLARYVARLLSATGQGTAP
jgi:riboflavin synthase